MGRARPAVRRSRVPLHRRAVQDPAGVRHWLVVGALALVVGVSVSQVVRRADDARAAWGETRSVLVVRRPVGPGDPLAGTVRAERWPRRLVPDAAVADLPDGARAAAALAPGTPLTDPAIRAPGTAGAGAAVAGRRLVSVPLASPTLDLAAGDVVDLWLVADVLELDVDRARRVAAEARVVRAEADSAVVAVRPGEVAAVAEAAADGTVVPVTAA